MYAFTIDSPDPRIRIELHQDEHAEAPWDTRSSLGSVISESLGDHLAEGEGRAAYFSAEGHWYEEEGSASARRIQELRFDGYSVIPFRHEDYGSSGDRIYECDPDEANGILYCSREKVAAEFVAFGYSWPKARRYARQNMRAELGELSAWASGDVYGYVVRAQTADDDDSMDTVGDEGEGSGEVLESVWGFYEAEVDYNHPEKMYVAEEALEAAQGCAQSLDAEDANRDDAAARDIATV